MAVSWGWVAAATAQDVVRGNLIQFNNNGGWCWFQDERAIIDPANGNLLVSSISDNLGYGGRASDMDVACYNLYSTARGVVAMGNFGANSDDHNSGALMLRPDGKYLVSWTSHGADTLTRYRISNSSGDAANWNALQTFDNADGSPGATYSNIFHLPNANPPVTYNFSRTDGYDPNFYASSDLGTSWSYAGHLAKDPASGTSGAYRPYAKYASNGSDRVYFMTTEAHPSQYGTAPYTGIYAGYVKDKAMYRMDGTLVRAAGAAMTTATAPYATEYTTVFAPSTVVNGTARNRCWTTDMAVDADGKPFGIFTSRVADSATDHRFYYTRWNGTSWEVHELAKAGGYLYSTAEPDYTGLVALNPVDPNEVYISTKVNPLTDATTASYEIYKGVTTDRGATWTWTAITQNSTMNNIRPILPAATDGTKALLWLRGTYTTYTDFDLAVVGTIDRPGLNPAIVIHYVDATSSNTSSVGGGSWLSGTGTGMGPADNLWYQRTGFGNSGSIYTADEGATEDAPMIKTTVTGVANNTYDVYAFIWSDKDEEWEIQASFNAAGLIAYEKLGAQHVVAGDLSGATTVDAGNGEHYLYKVYLGRTKVTNGTLSVFVDDGTGYLGGRTWYDGIGYSVAPTVPPALSTIGDQTLPFNTATSPIAFNVTDNDTPKTAVAVTGSAANASLIPAGNIAVSGTASSRNLVITPANGASGTTTVTLTANDGNATSSRTFQVTVLDRSQTWRQQNFGTSWNDEAIAGDTADPDHDGVSNLLERAFGGNPNLIEPNLMPAVDRTAPMFSIVYRKAKAATDLVFSVPQCVDLESGSWTPAQGTSAVVNDDGAVQLIRFTTSMGSDRSKFLRVEVAKQ